MRSDRITNRNTQTFEKLVARIATGLTVAILVAGLASAFRHVGEFFVTADQRGQRLLDAGDPEAAAAAFIDPRRRGVAQFIAGQFEESASTFAGLPGAEAAFNHGNSLIMLGKYEEAVQRYDRALELRPDWKPAEGNRAIASARAERLKHEGGDMTGGQLGADEIVFENTKSKQGSSETIEQGALSEEEMRGVWLRQVQTTPSDFLRMKFAYQTAESQNEEGANE
jgi:Ca-activated chloride channel family protein